jgi:uncharacterized membrane protein
MNVFLWIVQAILAVMFAMSGAQKAIQPKDQLAAKYLWMHDFSQESVRFIGVVEVLGAIGLIVPSVTGIAPVLAPVAGTGLAVLLVLAAAVHIRRREPRGVWVTAVLFALTVLVVWGRFGPYSL